MGGRIYKGGDGMMEDFTPLTTEDVEKVWGNANFGPALNDNKMELVKVSLLKWACGYTTGYTAWSILDDLGMMERYEGLSVKGKKQLWYFFKGDCAI